jgi:hypothetical protein
MYNEIKIIILNELLKIIELDNFKSGCIISKYNYNKIEEYINNTQILIKHIYDFKFNLNNYEILEQIILLQGFSINKLSTGELYLLTKN